MNLDYTRAPIPAVILEGDAVERGLTHGRARRDAIARAIEIYRGVFALHEDALAARAAHFAKVTRAFAPDLAVEMDAIAEGAGVAPHWIHALNARSELVSGSGANECTATYFSEHALQGQTWDWLQALEPLIAVLDVRYPDGHRILTLSEPGIVGKIGLSSAGIGVCLNFLRAPAPLGGVPVHVLLRALLDLRHPDDLEALLTRAGNGRSAHVLIGTADGRGMGLEFTGSHCHRLAPEDGILAHTNHFLCAPIDAGPGGPNSRTRLARARTLVATGARDWLTLTALLADCHDPEHPLSVSWRDMPGWDFGPMGTVCAVAMDLRTGVLEIRRGPDPAAPWQSFRLHGERLRLAGVE